MATGRKIVFVLGAGASLGAGATARVQHGGTISIPTQETFWSTYLRFCKSADRRKKIQSFLFKYFTEYSKVPARLTNKARNNLLASIDVEEVFTFISERIQSPGTTPQMKATLSVIWEAMTSEIVNVFGRFGPNRQTRQIYHEFSKKHLLAHDTVVSFNYDLIFERSLPTSQSWGYHCIDDTSRKLSIYKPHGSINWEINNGNIVVCKGISQNPVIVAPTHLKFVAATNFDAGAGTSLGYLNSAKKLFDIWAEMERELKIAKAIVFIGYSFPSADLYFSSLLRTIINSNTRKPIFVLVNPNSAEIAKRIETKFGIKARAYFDLKQFNKIPRKAMLG